MRHRSLLLVLALSSAIFLAPARSPAQVPPGGREVTYAVEKLYLDAVRDMDAGDLVAACPKLTKAVQLAPETAIGARLTLAECHERLGRLASAWREYVRVSEVVAGAGEGDPRKVEQRQEAVKQAARLEPKLARLTLRLPSALRAIHELEIQVDQLPVKEAGWDKPLPVDKGSHRITLSAAGYEKQEVGVTLAADGTKVEVELPMLVATAASVPAASTREAHPASEASAPVPGERSRLPGFIVGGVGVAAAIVGGALVGVASGKLSENATIAPKDGNQNPVCGKTPSAGESATCATLRSNADFAMGPGNAGIGMLVGGGVLIAAGALWLLIPSKKAADTKTSQVIPVVGKDGGGLVLTGSF